MSNCYYQNHREIDLLVIHCSATRSDKDFPVDALRRCHLNRGFADIGYHFYVTRDGLVHPCRPLHQMGAHVSGWNAHSIGICYEGGLKPDNTPADTRTLPQRQALYELVHSLLLAYPAAHVAGHYQLTRHIAKACPCFDARKEYAHSPFQESEAG